MANGYVCEMARVNQWACTVSWLTGLYVICYFAPDCIALKEKLFNKIGKTVLGSFLKKLDIYRSRYSIYSSFTSIKLEADIRNRSIILHN